MDKKKLGPPSPRAYNLIKRTDPPGTTGIKRDRLYSSPEYKAALTDISTEFRDKINQRQGKSDREPVGYFNTFRKQADKFLAENLLNRDKSGKTVKPRMKPR